MGERLTNIGTSITALGFYLMLAPHLNLSTTPENGLAMCVIGLVVAAIAKVVTQ